MGAANDAEIRLWIYRHFIEKGRAPSPIEIADAFTLLPGEVEASLERLQGRLDALVLLPDSPYIWMAEPFSAVPTSYRVETGDRVYWGNCIWDALAILALIGADGRVDAACAQSGEPLEVAVAGGRLVPGPGVAHFAVAARDWWRSIGFT